MCEVLYNVLSSVCVCVSAGMKKKEVQALVEDHLKDLVLKHFDPRKADRIFAEAGSVSDVWFNSTARAYICLWGVKWRL